MHDRPTKLLLTRPGRLVWTPVIARRNDDVGGKIERIVGLNAPAILRLADGDDILAKLRPDAEMRGVGLEVVEHLKAGGIARIVARKGHVWQPREGFRGMEMEAFIMAVPRHGDLVATFEHDIGNTRVAE